MGFCDQSCSLTNFAPKFYHICMHFVTTTKLSSNLESLHFPMFSAEMVMENQEMVMEK